MIHPERPELVVCAAPKDYNKLPFVLDAARRFVDLQAMHVIAPNIDELSDLKRWGAILHKDCDVLGYDKSALKYRPNWVFQQFLKLFQNVTSSDWYLVLDADIVVNKKLPLWSREAKAPRPILYVRREPVCEQYYLYNQVMLGYGKMTDFSLVAECTFYSRSLVQDMLVHYNMTQDMWWEKSCEVITESCYPAESELYGAYVLHAYPGLYKLMPLKYSLGGRYNNHVWSREEILEELDLKRSLDRDADVYSLHSWEGEV